MGDFRKSALANRIRHAMPLVTEMLLAQCQHMRFNGMQEITADDREDDADALLAAGLCMYGTGNHYGLPMPTDDPNRRECLIRAGALIVSQLHRMDREAAELAEDKDLAPDNSAGAMHERAADPFRTSLADYDAVEHAARNDDMRAGALSYVESREHSRDKAGTVRDLGFPELAVIDVDVTFTPLEEDRRVPRYDLLRIDYDTARDDEYDVEIAEPIE